jgi:rod shape-determining protein MreB
MSRWVGVDPGSSRLRAVVADGGDRRRMDAPSVVLARADGALSAARDEDVDRRGRRIGAPVLVRPIARGRIEREREAGVALRGLLDRIGGRMGRHALALAIPAGANSVEVRGWEELARSAGAHQVRLVPAPMARAATAGLLDGRGTLVVDLGATCSEAALIGPGGSVVERREAVGGVDLDRAVADYLRQHDRLVVGPRVAEEIKLMAAAAGGALDGERFLVTGRDAYSGAVSSVELSGAEVALAVRPVLERMVRVVELCLADAPDGLVEDVLGRGVVVGGGSASVPGLAGLLGARLGLAAWLLDDDGFAVASGALTVALSGIGEERALAPPLSGAGR